MDIVFDFILYMIASIKGEQIDKSDLSTNRKVIKKFIIYTLIIICAVSLFILLNKF